MGGRKMMKLFAATNN